MGSTQGAWGIWGRGDQLRSRSFTLFSFNIGGSLAEEAAAAAAAPHTCGRRQLLLLPRRIFLPALTSTRRLDDDTPANRMGRLNREGQRRFRRGLHRPRLRRRTPPPPPRVAAPSREACGASSSRCPEILSCTPIGMGSRARVHAGLAGRRRPMHRLRRPSRAVGPEIGEKEERRDVTLTCGSLTPSQLVRPDQSATSANYLGARGRFGPYLRE